MRIDYRYKDEEQERKEMILFIREYVKANGKTPIYAEIAEELGVSKNTVARRFRELVDFGLIIETAAGRARGYRLATKSEYVRKKE